MNYIALGIFLKILRSQPEGLMPFRGGKYKSGKNFCTIGLLAEKANMREEIIENILNTFPCHEGAYFSHIVIDTNDYSKRSFIEMADFIELTALRNLQNGIYR